MSDFQKYTSPVERSIATRLVEGALARGYRISVHDGGEAVLRRATDANDVYAALASTGSDLLTFYVTDAPFQPYKRVGWVVLIWGNDEDLISDYSDNEAINSLVEPILDSLD